MQTQEILKSQFTLLTFENKLTPASFTWLLTLLILWLNATISGSQSPRGMAQLRLLAGISPFDS